MTLGTCANPCHAPSCLLPCSLTPQSPSLPQSAKMRWNCAATARQAQAHAQEPRAESVAVSHWEISLAAQTCQHIMEHSLHTAATHPPTPSSSRYATRASFWICSHVIFSLSFANAHTPRCHCHRSCRRSCCWLFYCCCCCCCRPLLLLIIVFDIIGFTLQKKEEEMPTKQQKQRQPEKSSERQEILSLCLFGKL